MNNRIDPNGKLLWLWNTKNFEAAYAKRFHICLTIGLIRLFISFYWRAPCLHRTQAVSWQMFRPLLTPFQECWRSVMIVQLQQIAFSDGKLFSTFNLCFVIFCYCRLFKSLFKTDNLIQPYSQVGFTPELNNIDVI